MNAESKIERYYYLKDPSNGHYLGCVCLYRNPDTGKFFRGISLCNTEMDRFIKARARGIAYGRARSAERIVIGPDWENSEIGPKIEAKLKIIKDKYGLDLIDKDSLLETSFNNAVLTPFERRMWDDVLNPWPKTK